MWYLIIGFVAGAVLTVIPFVIWINRAKSGELQLYTQADAVYTVLRISSKQDFAKRYLLLKTVYVSEKEFFSRD